MIMKLKLILIFTLFLVSFPIAFGHICESDSELSSMKSQTSDTTDSISIKYINREKLAFSSGGYIDIRPFNRKLKNSTLRDIWTKYKEQSEYKIAFDKLNRLFHSLISTDTCNNIGKKRAADIITFIINPNGNVIYVSYSTAKYNSVAPVKSIYSFLTHSK